MLNCINEAHVVKERMHLFESHARSLPSLARRRACVRETHLAWQARGKTRTPRQARKG